MQAQSKASKQDGVARNYLARSGLPFTIALALGGAPVNAGPMLTGFALLDANTFVEGPTSGQFITPNNGITPPFIDKQPLQGFSAVLDGPTTGTYYVMPDNGFGAKKQLRRCPVARLMPWAPDFKTATGGSGTVSPVNFDLAAVLSAFDNSSFIGLRDPIESSAFRLSRAWRIIRMARATSQLHLAITSGRLLTGSDFDIESVRKDKNGNLWFGDEFGPFLLKTDATGKQCCAAKSHYQICAVSARTRSCSRRKTRISSAAENLRETNGFEGMAINSTGDKPLPVARRPAHLGYRP